MTIREHARITTTKFQAIAAPKGHRSCQVATIRPIAVLPEYTVAQYACECGFPAASRVQLTQHHEIVRLITGLAEAA